MLGFSVALLAFFGQNEVAHDLFVIEPQKSMNFEAERAPFSPDDFDSTVSNKLCLRSE